MEPVSNQGQQSNGLGIAALVTGIIALLLSLIPVIGFISWILAPAAIILGIVGMRQRDVPRGMAIAGLATGGVALLICIMWAALFTAAISNMPNTNFPSSYDR